MSEQLIAKLVITGAGLAVFFVGVRTENDLLRWIGIGLVAVAFLLRFIGTKGRAK
jgi:hypothetical protein